jgi:hypothetical protein
MDVWMFRDHFLDTVIPFFGVYVGDCFENIQNIPFIAHELDKILASPHGGRLYISRDCKAGRRGQVGLSAKRDDQDAASLQRLKKPVCSSRITGKDAESFIPAG